ncbi:MAG: ATP-binding protein, partial [Candidatus Fimenecus sp.]
GEFWRITVFNTGEPIADEDIGKIWDSFYRADKSHSRKEGRFGLGLSIVSEIQKLHKAAYGVENRDGGVAFWFDVLCAQ